MKKLNVNDSGYCIACLRTTGNTPDAVENWVAITNSVGFVVAGLYA